MYVRCITAKDGVTRLYYYENYYEPSPVKGEKGKTRSRMVEPIGTLEELKKIYDDPVAHFKKEAAEKTAESRRTADPAVTLDMSETLSAGTDDLKNVGYGILKELYLQLGLDKFWKKRVPRAEAGCDAEAIFRLLVISRVMDPSSERAAYGNRETYFGGAGDFSLEDMYHALALFPGYREKMQDWIFDHSEKICPRDMGICYYFRADLPCGPDWLDPGQPGGEWGTGSGDLPGQVIRMGLLTDHNGIPDAYDILPADGDNGLRTPPSVRRMRSGTPDGRVIQVAGRERGAWDDVYSLVGDGPEGGGADAGYVYGFPVAEADAGSKEWALSGEGYSTDTVTDADGEERLFKHKSRICPRPLRVHELSADGTGTGERNVTADQKQMVCYSEVYAEIQEDDREDRVWLAKDLIQHPADYDRASSAGFASYVAGIAYDEDTGGVAENAELSLDEEKIAEEAKYDGYYIVVTGELDMPDPEMRRLCLELDEIRCAFQFPAPDPEGPYPVPVRGDDRLASHFETCFTAMVLFRLLQAKLDNRFPAGKILNALRRYDCIPVDANIYQFVYYDEVLQACEEAFGICLNNRYLTRLDLRRLLRY